MGFDEDLPHASVVGAPGVPDRLVDRQGQLWRMPCRAWSMSMDGMGTPKVEPPGRTSLASEEQWSVSLTRSISASTSSGCARCTASGTARAVGSMISAMP
ncbi:hypothetical protein ACFYXF_51525 [Streptomyces sp. NPDC002680]|uniref:hypothetical protein n=1 Tax=Streptomyces sp. NPDC002680 TaxID=3364659 RepID=UPI0036C70F60